jgi:hypothetical protein
MPEKVNGSKRATVEYSGEAPLGRELGMPWDEESIWGDYEGGKVFDYDPWSAREIVKMLEKDGKAALIEQVLTQPVARLTWDLEPARGDKGEAEFVRAALERPGSSGGMSVPLEFIIHQATSAFGLRKAYFEKVFKISDRGDTAGKVIYDKIAFRPSSTCQVARDARTGAFRGFRQVPYAVAEAMPRGGNIDWINIPEKRAWVYIHGQHRDPMRGVSSLEITYWAFQTKMKIRWLWMKFLEKQALPSIVVQGPEAQAKQAAAKLLGLKNNGIAQIDGAVSWSKVDQAGNGSALFLDALRFLDSEMANSIMAGFTNLTDSATDGRGSYALAKDASDFFLKSRQAAADELAQSISHYLVADLVRYNFGPEAEAPKFKFGQMVDADVADILTTFNTLVGSTANNLPGEFTYMLAEKVADYMDLDTDKLRAEFDKHAKEKEEQAKRMAQMQMGGHLVNAAAQKEAIKRGGMVGRAAGAATAAAKVMGKPGEQKPGEKKLSVEKDHGTVFEVPALPWHEDDDEEAIILAVEGGGFVDLDGNTVELASVKVGGSYQHVPGTAYNWRHGWEPLNIRTALKHRKRLAARKLSKHTAEEPTWYQGLHPEKGTTVRIGSSKGEASKKIKLRPASEVRKGWKVGTGLEVERIEEDGDYRIFHLKGGETPFRVHSKSRVPVHSQEQTIGLKDLRKNPVTAGDAGGDKLPYSGKAETSKVAQADLGVAERTFRDSKRTSEDLWRRMEKRELPEPPQLPKEPPKIGKDWDAQKYIKSRIIPEPGMSDETIERIGGYFDKHVTKGGIKPEVFENLRMVEANKRVFREVYGRDAGKNRDVAGFYNHWDGYLAIHPDWAASDPGTRERNQINMSAAKRSGWWPQSDTKETLEHIVHHEIGHFLHYVMDEPEQAKMGDLVRTEARAWAKERGLDHLPQRLIEKRFISEYGTTNHKELVAEMWAAYVGGTKNERINKLGAEMAQMVNDAFERGERLREEVMRKQREREKAGS